jgi:hypothetical protein
MKGKTIPVADREGLYDCEKSRISHFLNSWLTDGEEVIIITRRQRFTAQEEFWYAFLL